MEGVSEGHTMHRRGYRIKTETEQVHWLAAWQCVLVAVLWEPTR